MKKQFVPYEWKYYFAAGFLTGLAALATQLILNIVPTNKEGILGLLIVVLLLLLFYAWLRLAQLMIQKVAFVLFSLGQIFASIVGGYLLCILIMAVLPFVPMFVAYLLGMTFGMGVGLRAFAWRQLERLQSEDEI